MADISIGNNANLLKGAIDSHDTINNVVTNTTNNSTVYEAQKTMQEIIQDNENEFLKAVNERYADGMLTSQKMAELQQIALKWKITPLRANQIIDQVRKNMAVIQGGQGSKFLAGEILNEVFNAIQTNELEILKRKFLTLEKLARTSTDGNVQFYYHLLLASLWPENCVVGFINSRTDNYWQLYWAYVAFVKLGNIDSAVALLPRFGGFGCPQGDIALLMAIDNIAEYRKNNNHKYYQQQAQKYLDEACKFGMSEQLGSLWYAAQEMIKDEQIPQEWFRFYCGTTLKELAPVKSPSMPQYASQMQTPPPVPKFNAQNVNLIQMQGFNPLQAAKQMGLGEMPSMEQTQRELDRMSRHLKSGMSQIPSMSFQKNGTAEFVIPENPNSPEPEEIYPLYGIIFTDSLALAEKYGCESQEVYDILDDFIQKASEAQMYWYLLDAGFHSNSLDHDSWTDYNELLGNYIIENGFQTGVCTPVFIIGGSDVIPVPEIKNPLWGDKIPTDMAYCFATSFFENIIQQNQTLDYDQVRNTVARLPLENGEMITSLQDDLQSYFNICSIFSDGIEVQSVAMASNASWAENSVTMSQHLPLIYHKSNDESEVYKGMYMCPKLITDAMNADIQIDSELLSCYKRTITQAGMLLFNLHGSNEYCSSGFYCEGGGGYPESFDIELLKLSNARVFNTVACFGARYDGYEKENSMLLSALYDGGKLLFAGSTVSVPMIPDNEQNYPKGSTQYPGSGSEKFMPIYCYYTFCGMPAGQAMMRAKIDYFNVFRHIERDDFSLATVMMFGLYGNPMLHVKKRSDVIEAAQQYEVLPHLPKTTATTAHVRMPHKSCLISKHQLQESDSLLDQIRGCVDQNLAVIHDMVMQNLYKTLGLESCWLEQIDAYQLSHGDGTIDRGYVYYFDGENKHGRKSMIEVNKNGQITRRVTYK